MRLLSPRLLVPLAVVVITWGGVHLLGSRNLAVTPAVWPGVAAGATATAPAASLVAPVPARAPSPSPRGGIPVLPGAMQQLNSNTRDTALGLYALIQQLEHALASRLEQLATQLEPGR